MFHRKFGLTVRFLFAPVVCQALLGCQHNIATNVSPHLHSPDVVLTSNVGGLIAALPDQASTDELTQALRQLVPAIMETPGGRREDVYTAAQELSRQPNFVTACANVYAEFQPSKLDERLALLSLLGNARRVDSQALLQSIIAAPLPSDSPVYLLLSPRQQVEITMEKAVHALGYLRLPETFEALKTIAVEHPSDHIKYVAVDTYLWNKGDSVAARTEVQSFLPKERWCEVALPRFTSSISSQQFSSQVEAWLARCGGNAANAD